MANYSTTADLIAIVPNASGSLIASATFDADWLVLADDAYREVNDYIVDGTAVPSGEDLAEVEALLVAHRAVTARYQAIDQEASDDFRQDFKKRAYELLDGWEFPASYSTAIQSSGFVGGGSIALTVYDDWTNDGKWMARCITAGGADAVFQVWRTSVTGTQTWTYDLGSMTQFPDDSVLESGNPEGLATQIRIEVTASGNDFALGDFWLWRTHANWRKKRKKGPRFIKLVRG
jgi:hypothetical protein